VSLKMWAIEKGERTKGGTLTFKKPYVKHMRSRAEPRQKRIGSTYEARSEAVLQTVEDRNGPAEAQN